MQFYSPPKQDLRKPRKLVRSTSKANKAGSKAPSIMDSAVSQAYSIDQEHVFSSEPRQLVDQLPQIGQNQLAQLLVTPKKQAFPGQAPRQQGNILRINQSAIRFAQQQIADHRYAVRNNALQKTVATSSDQGQPGESSSKPKWVSNKRKPTVSNIGSISNPGMVLSHHLGQYLQLSSENTTLQMMNQSPENSRQQQLMNLHPKTSIGNSLRSSLISLSTALRQEEIQAKDLKEPEPNAFYADSKQLRRSGGKPTLEMPNTDPSPKLRGKKPKKTAIKDKPRKSLHSVYPSDLVKIAEQTNSSVKEKSLSPGARRRTSNEAQLSIAKLCQSLKERNASEETEVYSPPGMASGMASIQERPRGLNVKVPRRSDAKSELLAAGKKSDDEEVKAGSKMTRNSKSILSSQRNPGPIIEVNESPSRSQASLPKSVAQNFIKKITILDKKRQAQVTQVKPGAEMLPVLNGKNLTGQEASREPTMMKRVSMTRTRYKFVKAFKGSQVPRLDRDNAGFQIQMMCLKSREQGIIDQTLHSRLESNRLLIKGTASKQTLPKVQRATLKKSGKRRTQPLPEETQEANQTTIKDSASVTHLVGGTSSVESRNSDHLNSNQALGLCQLPKYSSQGGADFNVLTQSVQNQPEPVGEATPWNERKTIIAISPFGKPQKGGGEKDFDIELKKLTKKKKKKAFKTQASVNQASTGSGVYLGSGPVPTKTSIEEMDCINLFQWNSKPEAKKGRYYNSQNPQEASLHYNDDSSSSELSQPMLPRKPQANTSVITSRVENYPPVIRRTSRGGDWGLDSFLNKQDIFKRQGKLDEESPLADESLLDFQQYVKYKENSPSKQLKGNNSSKHVKLYKFRSSQGSVVNSPLKKRVYRTPAKIDDQDREEGAHTSRSPAKESSHRGKYSAFRRSPVKQLGLSPNRSEGSNLLLSPSLKSPLRRKQQSVVRSPAPNWWDYQVPASSKKAFTSIPTLQAIYGGESEQQILTQAGFKEPLPPKKSKKEKKQPTAKDSTNQVEREARLERLKLSKLIDVRNEGTIEPQRKAIQRVHRYNQLMEQLQQEEAKREREMMRRLRIRRGKKGIEEDYDEEDEEDSLSYDGESEYSPA